MINVWTKYGEARLYGNEETDLIMKTWHNLNKVSTPYKKGDLLKEVKFIWNFIWQDKKKETF
jgi:hypothetical protein